MSEQIKCGDLVMVVRACCAKWLGQIFVVESIGHVFGFFEFTCCGKPFPSQGMDVAWNKRTEADGTVLTAPLEWLKKINPPDSLESVETKEEIPA